jgi:hypothetical protein
MLRTPGSFAAHGKASRQGQGRNLPVGDVGNRKAGRTLIQAKKLVAMRSNPATMQSEIAAQLERWNFGFSGKDFGSSGHVADGNAVAGLMLMRDDLFQVAAQIGQQDLTLAPLVGSTALDAVHQRGCEAAHHGTTGHWLRLPRRLHVAGSGHDVEAARVLDNVQLGANVAPQPTLDRAAVAAICSSTT